jgi:YbbR domain-containing protein
VRRVADFLVRNWPLKLGAILLATVLYGGLVLGQNVRSYTGSVPVEALGQPNNVSLLTELPAVTEIRYRAPLDVGVLSPASFNATIDVSDVPAEAGAPPVAVPITLLALDPDVEIVDFQPRDVQIQLDPVIERQMSVSVTHNLVPDSVTAGTPQVEPGTVTLRGAVSRIDSVAAVQARVDIDASALNIDSVVEAVPVDANGNEVPNVNVEPERVRVRIPIAQAIDSRTLPVVPTLAGTVAPGYRIESVTVEPLVMTVSGDAAVVGEMQNVPTAAIDMNGRTTDLEANVAAALPAGVTPSQTDDVRVMIQIVEETGSLSFTTGVTLENEAADLGYSIGAQQISVTLSGPLNLLRTVDGASLIATADVSRLTPGIHSVRLSVEPPDGLDVVAIDPPEVSIGVISLVTPPAVASPSP